MNRRSLFMLMPILMMCLLVSSAAQGQQAVTYEITVTNLTKGQTFTPILAAIHSADLELFRLGTPASAPLEILAEAGDTGPLSDALLALGGAVVGAVETAPGLLGPEETHHRNLQIQDDVDVALSGKGEQEMGTQRMALRQIDRGPKRLLPDRLVRQTDRADPAGACDGCSQLRTRDARHPHLHYGVPDPDIFQSHSIISTFFPGSLAPTGRIVGALCSPSSSRGITRRGSEEVA